MANFCLLPNKIEEFKKALKDKEINMADLINMSTEDRTKLLENYAGANAKDVNTLFEQKLVLKNRVQGIKNWASKLGEIGRYSKEGKAEFEKALQEYQDKQKERIFSPEENQAFLNDLADKRLGTHVTKEEAQKVFDLTQKMDAVKNVDAKMSGVSDEYLKTRKELNNYISSLNEISVPKSILDNLATIVRNNLLMNPATPIKTTIGQIVNSSMDFFTRRIGTLSAKGLNGDLVKQANKEAWDTFMKTGDNTTLMSSVDDTSKLGEGHNFDENKGTVNANKAARVVEKAVRKVAHISNKIAIDWEHNFAFTKFYQKAFFDMVNLMSTNIAKKEGLTGEELKTRAAEIFKDAAKIDPQTEEGRVVRSEAQKQGARVTSTNETWVGELSVQVKRFLNKKVPHLGDVLVPIAKIPTNLIWNGIENSGIGLFGIKDMAEGFKKIQSEDLNTRYEGMSQFANGFQRTARTLGTLGTAAIIASQLSKDDFRTDKYGNHFVKIGNIWINTEYISAFSPALSGMMLVKSKGGLNQKPEDIGAEYVAGAAEDLKNLPVVSDINQAITDITNSSFSKGIGKYLDNFRTSRFEPTFLANLQKDRPIQRLFFGANGVETDQQVKQDTLNAKNKKITTEDWTTSKSKEYQQFKQIRGLAALKNANTKYNAELARNLPRLQNSKAFQDSTPDQQQADTTKLETTIKTRIFRSYGFKYKAPKQRKNPTVLQIINSSQ